MKKILVTGGEGFLGRAVVSHLDQGSNAAGLAVQTFRSTEYDLRDPRAVAELLREKKPSIVVHLAARVGGIGANREFPGTLFYDNISMGVNLIEACRQAGVEHFVLAGTVCSYPKFCPVPFREEDLWAGFPEETNAPYGIAKKALFVQLAAYRDQFDFQSTRLLIVNLYGPGDNFSPSSSHVIPAMLRKFHEAKLADLGSVQLWGDGSASREFLYVDDAARAISLALQHGPIDQPMNLGTGQEISMKDLASLIREIVDYEGAIVWDSRQPNGQPRRCLDTSRAQETLGFTASMELREGLQRTYRWFCSHFDEIRSMDGQRERRYRETFGM